MTGVIVNVNLDFYTKVVQAVEASGGKCFIVQLTASELVLKNRVGHESRKNYNKISTKQDWEDFYIDYPEMYRKFSNKKHLVIDTTDVLPQKAAQKIINYYKLT